jgi:hypothetical protein
MMPTPTVTPQTSPLSRIRAFGGTGRPRQPADDRVLIAEVIAERTGADLDRDLGPHLLAGAVTTAITTSVGLWAGAATETPLPDLVRDCLAQLRAGLPVGAAVPAA